MNDVDLLRRSVLRNPTDTALLAAYIDALIENVEDTAAELVCIVRQRLLDGEGLFVGESEDDRRCRLLYWMGLRPIQIADWLNYDNEGTVYPVDRPSQRTIGQAMAYSDEGRVRILIRNGILIDDGRVGLLPIAPRQEIELVIGELNVKILGIQI